jgi:hypothetical protein
MRTIAAMIVAAAFAPPLPQTVNPHVYNRPPPACDLGGSVLWQQSRLPPGAVAALPFRMADPDQSFDIADDIGLEPLPSHRLICAKRIGRNYLIRFEHGGCVYRIETIVLRRVPGGYDAQ